ncbi:hypothetical protein Fleli_3043 [Bernardetia litoralis DSM 6794]|uniref:Uncharacterized protein n=1 Tax=Bernardetia litoralis (strain ATCC 23117 / DSM 6794 / NBRC 15988 / NCIMB 1366 / Fx l1 / Sio-4) TaxID=880071 RepID=I4AN49_BERLS|nr:hypothetical protein [Bernardetia litoralis]AFM05384.1 hypothetical protein Fleli_3043 [Bernardetia litoralis DSM 6794]
MNAEVPTKKIFTKTFIFIGGVFSMLFFFLFCFIFMRSYAEARELDLYEVVGVLTLYLVSTTFFVLLYFLMILYYHKTIRNKIINFDYVITKITEKKFYFEKDDLEYTLEVIYSKSMRLILSSKDNEINTTFYSVKDLESELAKLEA